jgi:transposase-like protein
MKKSTTTAGVVPAAIVDEAWQEVGASFERFCLTAGLATLAAMMDEDATELCGPRYGRADGKDGHRWGKTTGKVGFHGGKVEVERPRVRTRDGGERALPSWEAALSEDLLGKWALNLMLINVSTRKFDRAVRLPGGDVPSPKGAGVSKSAVSRRFVALSAERMQDWMAADLSELDLLAIQIDGIHIEDDLMLLAAVGIDGAGEKHPLGVIEGASENAAVAQALLDNLVGRGLDRRSAVCSSSTVPRRCPRRSATPSAATPRSSAARSTRPATSPSGCPSPCRPASARRCVRRGNWTTPTRRKS